MWFRSPLLAGALGALVLAGCGSDDAALIPKADAEQLTALVSDAGEATSAGECERARRAVAEAEARLGGLPRKTDARLKANLEQWLSHLDKRIASDCKAPETETETEPEPEQTATATPTPTETPTETPTPTATPTATATPAPTTTVEPETPEEPAGTGGVPPEDDG